jgi:hypothetical protein
MRAQGGLFREPLAPEIDKLAGGRSIGSELAPLIARDVVQDRGLRFGRRNTNPLQHRHRVLVGVRPQQCRAAPVALLMDQIDLPGVRRPAYRLLRQGGFLGIGPSHHSDLLVGVFDLGRVAAVAGEGVRMELEQAGGGAVHRPRVQPAFNQAEGDQRVRQLWCERADARRHGVPRRQRARGSGVGGRSYPAIHRAINRQDRLVLDHGVMKRRLDNQPVGRRHLRADVVEQFLGRQRVVSRHEARGRRLPERGGEVQVVDEMGVFPKAVIRVRLLLRVPRGPQVNQGLLRIGRKRGDGRVCMSGDLGLGR